MRRRSSGSTTEDEDNDHNDRFLAAGVSDTNDDVQSRRTSSDSRHEVKRTSGTLDRRKRDATYAAPPRQPGWSPPPPTANGSLHRKQKAHNPMTPDTTFAPMNESPMPRRSRSHSPWSCSLLTVATTALAFVILLSIVNSFVTRQLDPKGCRMSMMRPAFAKFSDFDTEHTRFASKYSLYLYREGGIDEDTRVKGVPVLFIPGNAGSYKQVRPLAAEAAQYFHDTVQHDGNALKAGTRSLDFFTVDFNEDITAFHGQTLLDQAEYLNEAVAYILSLYHDPRRSRKDPNLPDPSSVILIGHSMGGIVARTMLTMANYQSNSINTIITMSAPHARPPVSFDADIVRTYKQINDYWRQAYSQKWANNNPLWHVTLISIAGGGLDTVVPSDYASTSSLVPDTHGFTVFTSSVPNVWTGMDHLSILWCDQFRRVIVRSLIDVVDVHRSAQTKPRAERMRVFRKWYLTGMESVAEKLLPQQEPTTLLTLEDNSNSIISPGERLTLRGFGRSGKPKAHLLPVPPQGTPEGQRFTLLSDQKLDATGDGGKLEVLFCSVFPLQAGQSATLFSMNMDLSGDSTGSTRLACKSAACDNINLPASTRKSKYAFEETDPLSYLQYGLDDLAEHQFVAIVDKAVEPTSGWVMAEFSDNSESIIKTSVGLGRLLVMGLRIDLPATRPMVTEVAIPALHSSLLAYKLSIGTQACEGEMELFTLLLRQYISAPYESKFFVNVRDANINLHGIAPFMPPPLQVQSTTSGLSLQLWSDTSCNTSVDLSLKVDISGSLGKLVMRYRTVFAAFPLLVVALVLRKQFKRYDETGVFMSFAESMDLCLRSSLPLFLLAMSFFALSLARPSLRQPKQVSTGFFHWGANTTQPAVNFAQNDLLLGSQDPFFWFLIPLLGLVSTGVCIVIHYAALALIHIFATTYGLLNARPAWLSNDDKRRNASLASPATSPRRRLITIGALLFLVSTFIPYQFAYIVACIVQIATCTRALRFARETRSGAHYNFYNYSHSILVLMIWILPIHIPVLVVWVHNLAVHWLTPFSSHHNVLSIMPLILLVETMTSGRMIPRVTTRLRYITNISMVLLATCAAVYGITYAYLLHHLANLVAAWLFLVHCSGTDWSFSGLSQMLGADGENVEGGDSKKRP